MIFSIGYGHDENGKFTMNFGPINRAGGYRRLNVAITRARRRVEVVSSVGPSQFGHSDATRECDTSSDTSTSQRKANPLLLSRSATQASTSRARSRTRLFESIRSWGYDAVPQVGAAGYRIDIGVRHPIETGRYALAVECDGAMYHSSRVARDRDRLRQEVLEGLGWRLHRIWGTSWYRDRRRQETVLRAAIEHAISPDSQPPRTAPTVPVWVDETFEVFSPTSGRCGLRRTRPNA